VAERERKMLWLYTVEGLTLAEIACRFRVSPERVRQLLCAYVHASTGVSGSPRELSGMAARARQARKLALTWTHADEIVAAWRAGAEPAEIAVGFDLGRRRVELVIRETITPEDRATRARARRFARTSQASGRPDSS
jgi:hypothetical protein